MEFTVEKQLEIYDLKNDIILLYRFYFSREGRIKLGVDLVHRFDLSNSIQLFVFLYHVSSNIELFFVEIYDLKKDAKYLFDS